MQWHIPVVPAIYHIAVGRLFDPRVQTRQHGEIHSQKNQPTKKPKKKSFKLIAKAHSEI